MSGDSGFASGDSSGVNPFTSGMLGGGFGGFGGFGSFSSGLDEPAVDTGQHQGTGDAVVGQNADGASKTSTEIQEETKKPTLGSREQVLANPEQYGWKPGMTASPEEYAQQYFHEAAAKLSYKDPSIDGDKKGDPNAKDGYTAADKAFLEQWGYKVGPEVRGNGALGNTDSGMYAVRFEPIDPKSGTAPVVAFRGSEFNEKMVDWRSDITDGTIGQRQYKESQKAIDELMKVAPGQKLEVTGHSLGGALAQKAAAEHAASIGAVSTFQAPGVDAADAAKFNANKADGVKVNHHYVSSDIVHRAGEQKLDGNFYEHHVPGAGMGDIGASHTANLLHNTGQVDENGVNKYIDSDKNGFENKRDSVTHHEKDAQGDRHFFEGLRQLLGNGLGGPIEGVVTGIAKAGGGIMTGMKDIGAGLKNGFMSAMHGITGGMSTAWDGAKKGGSELVGGFKQMMSGNILSGLGGMGKGLMSGAGGLLSGAGQAIGGVASGAWEGAKGLGSGLWNAGKGLLGGAEDVIGGLGRGWLGGAQGPGAPGDRRRRVARGQVRRIWPITIRATGSATDCSKPWAAPAKRSARLAPGSATQQTAPCPASAEALAQPGTASSRAAARSSRARDRSSLAHRWLAWAPSARAWWAAPAASSRAALTQSARWPRASAPARWHWAKAPGTPASPWCKASALPARASPLESAKPLALPGMAPRTSAEPSPVAPRSCCLVGKYQPHSIDP
jgi:hypothetical protein